MTRDTNTTIPDLIKMAVGQGMTRARIADAIGCSRVQLWRLEKVGPAKETALTRRIRELLGQADPLQPSLHAAVRRIAGSDPNRRGKVLHLLLAIDDLLTGPREAGAPGDEL